MARDDAEEEGVDKEEGAEKAGEATLGKAEATTAAEAAAEEGEADAEARGEGERRAKGARSRKARRDAEGREGRSARAAQRERVRNSQGTSAGSRLALVGVAALAVGVAVGWFGHQARAKAKLREASGSVTAGSSGPCRDWEGKICAGSGDESAICQQAKGAAELLTGPICESALDAVPATLAKAKAARAPCDNLVEKACKDLPEGSSTCKMVRERTPSFPVDRCKEMLEQYDQVLQELQAIEAQGGPPSDEPGQGAPPGQP